jgi:hypothetical protein
LSPSSFPAGAFPGASSRFSGSTTKTPLEIASIRHFSRDVRAFASFGSFSVDFKPFD